MLSSSQTETIVSGITHRGLKLVYRLTTFCSMSKKNIGYWRKVSLILKPFSHGEQAPISHESNVRVKSIARCNERVQSFCWRNCKNSCLTGKVVKLRGKTQAIVGYNVRPLLYGLTISSPSKVLHRLPIASCIPNLLQSKRGMIHHHATKEEKITAWPDQEVYALLKEQMEAKQERLLSLEARRKPSLDTMFGPCRMGSQYHRQARFCIDYPLPLAYQIFCNQREGWFIIMPPKKRKSLLGRIKKSMPFRHRRKSKDEIDLPASPVSVLDIPHPVETVMLQDFEQVPISPYGDTINTASWNHWILNKVAEDTSNQKGFLQDFSYPRVSIDDRVENLLYRHAAIGGSEESGDDYRSPSMNETSESSNNDSSANSWFAACPEPTLVPTTPLPRVVLKEIMSPDWGDAMLPCVAQATPGRPLVLWSVHPNPAWWSDRLSPRSHDSNWWPNPITCMAKAPKVPNYTSLIMSLNGIYNSLWAVSDQNLLPTKYCAMYMFFFEVIALDPHLNFLRSNHNWDSSRFCSLSLSLSLSDPLAKWRFYYNQSAGQKWHPELCLKRLCHNFS